MKLGRCVRKSLTGDSHRHLLARLRDFAGEIDFEVAFDMITGSAGGWCDPARGGSS